MEGPKTLLLFYYEENVGKWNSRVIDTNNKLSCFARGARVVFGQLKALPACELIPPPNPPPHKTASKHTPEVSGKKSYHTVDRCI